MFKFDIYNNKYHLLTFFFKVQILLFFRKTTLQRLMKKYERLKKRKNSVYEMRWKNMTLSMLGNCENWRRKMQQLYENWKRFMLVEFFYR